MSHSRKLSQRQTTVDLPYFDPIIIGLKLIEFIMSAGPMAIAVSLHISSAGVRTKLKDWSVLNVWCAIEDPHDWLN